MLLYGIPCLNKNFLNDGCNRKCDLKRGGIKSKKSTKKSRDKNTKKSRKNRKKSKRTSRR